jgi:hypothetical protein
VAKPTTALPGAVLEGFSAGTYRWSDDPTLLKVVIHTAMAVSDLEGNLQWERAGAQREFEVIFVDDQLSLVRRGEAEFNSMRIKPRPDASAPKTRWAAVDRAAPTNLDALTGNSRPTAGAFEVLVPGPPRGRAPRPAAEKATSFEFGSAPNPA